MSAWTLAKPLAEPVRGRPQRQLGIDVKLARDGNQREERVPHLVEALLAPGPLAPGLLAPALLHDLTQLADLLERLLHRAWGISEVEPSRGRPPLDLARVEQAGQVLGDLTEQARLATGLGCLYTIPVAQHLARGRG